MRRPLLVLIVAVGLSGCRSGEAFTPSSPTPTSGPTPGPGAPPPPAIASVQGVVVDSAYRPIAGADVAVADGPHIGLATVTDSTGSFSFTTPIEPGTQFRATAVDHVPGTTVVPPRCPTCGVTSYISFYLARTVPAVSIAGEYTLTVTAEPSCRLPDEARTRTYRATIAPSADTYTPPGTSYLLTLSGVSFFPDYHITRIGVAGDAVSIVMGDHGPALVEQLNSSNFISYEGMASGSAGNP